MSPLVRRDSISELRPAIEFNVDPRLDFRRVQKERLFCRVRGGEGAWFVHMLSPPAEAGRAAVGEKGRKLSEMERVDLGAWLGVEEGEEDGS